MDNGKAAKHYVAEVAKTFGCGRRATETLGEFRYDTLHRRPLPL